MSASKPVANANYRLSIIPEIIEQHAIEAAFLWMQRDAAVSEPHYSLSDLAELDERIEAHIDGLRIADQTGWKICLSEMAELDTGTVFPAAVLAFESGDNKRIETVIASARENRESLRELISALGWINPQQFSAMLTRLANSQNPIKQYLAITACRIRPEASAHLTSQIIKLSLTNESAEIRAQALRAIGELKCHELAPALHHSSNNNRGSQSDSSPQNNKKADCQFWAAWSNTLLQRANSTAKSDTFPPALNSDIAIINHHAISSSALQKHALQLLLRVMDASTTKNWLQTLAAKAKSNSGDLRTLIMAIGIYGDPVYMPTLLSQMTKPEVARLAGESFTMITGIDLAYQDLDSDWPEDFSAGPNEDPDDENVAMDIDESLPWPDAEKVATWWQAHQQQFNPDCRYLVGKPINTKHCQHVLANGMQRQRMAATLELALLKPGTPLLETRAPAKRQRILVELWSS